MTSRHKLEGRRDGVPGDDPELDDLVRDPLLRGLPWVPSAFHDLAPGERRWRGRAFWLAYIATGGGSGAAIALSWHMAMTTDPEAEADNRRLVEAVPDEAILGALEALRTR